MSSYTEMFGKRHTEFALSLFCRSAVKVLNEQGFKETPSEEQLYGLIMKDVFGDEEISSPPKNIPRDDDAKKVEDSEVPPAEVPKKITNLSSKDLKKNPLKITQKELNKDGTEVEVEVEIAFPYLAEVDYSETCQSLKVNGGLFTPCLTRPAKGSTFCKTCAKAGHKYGTFEKRSNCSILCYADPKGKKEISFGTWVQKRGMERAEVESKIQEQYGISLPEEYWVPDKSKASRAVKTVSTSSDDEASVESDKSPPQKRGRPKKVSVDDDTKVTEELKEEPITEDESTQEVEDNSPVEVSIEKKNGAIKKVSVDDDTKVTEELKEEPITEDESTQEVEDNSPVEVSIEKKNGAIKKLDAEHFLVFWDGTTYVVDNDDNCVWEHDADYEIVTCVGEWNPETKEVKLD